jgi:hypothetical protein
MRGKVEAKSWVTVLGECSISYRPDGSGEIVDFRFGDSQDCFEFGFDAESLRRFLKVGNEALRDMAQGDPSTR